MTADSTSLGPFTVALLAELRDEYPRIPILCFSILSAASPGHTSTSNVLHIPKWPAHLSNV